jgi:hypothetical protein
MEECSHGKVTLQKKACIMISFEKSKNKTTPKPKNSYMYLYMMKQTENNVKTHRSCFTNDYLWGATESRLGT